ncbi:MAG: hypothetical protein GY834_08325 [Bacteroidetes bacterium]|nr:hypothetical protein [Bacteroidota bacterium]
MNLHNQHTIKAELINGGLACNGRLGYVECPYCQAIYELYLNNNEIYDKKYTVVSKEKCESCGNEITIKAELVLIKAVFEVEVKGV